MNSLVSAERAFDSGVPPLVWTSIRRPGCEF